jgi:hypothetical protein
MVVEAESVVSGLSRLIAQDLTVFGNESFNPGFDADRMDARLKFYSERAEKLNQLRAEFEKLMFTGAP